MIDDLTTNNSQQEVRSFAFVLVIFASLVLAAGFMFSGFAMASTKLDLVINDKINPNDAPVESLIRLPGIGLSRANAIVEFRKKMASRDIRLPFSKAADLCAVNGLGNNIVEEIRPYLSFDRVD